MMKKKEETLQDKIYNYPTKYKEGFIQEEMDKLLKEYPDANMDRWNDALTGITCMVKDNHTIIYHCDILTALRCATENRGLKTYEFD